MLKLIIELLFGKVEPLTYEEQWKVTYFSKEVI